jgi:integration host factor subunit beta
MHLILKNFYPGGYMNKLELISQLKKEANLTKSEASEIVRIFFDSMTDALANGERVEIRGLCSFFIKEYKSYTGRNPKTGEKVKIPPKKLPFFKCGKELKERVDTMN